MSNTFIGRGNLGAAPELKHVEVDGESRSVASLRVYFDRLVPDGADGFEDRGGFWLDVSLWGARAEAAVKVLTKGARVSVIGTLVQRTWTDKNTGHERTQFELQADQVDLDISRVERAVFRKKEKQDAEAAE